MRRALLRLVVPVLRARGFDGEYPHFRRSREGQIDLLSFQTDKWGGGFLVEIAKCPSSNIRDWAGHRVAANRVTAQHLLKRHRLPDRPRRRQWYRYDDRSVVPEEVAEAVLADLERVAGPWWRDPTCGW